MIKKIDLTYMPLKTQDSIWSWCLTTFGKSGPKMLWSWHEQPSRRKFWIELNSSKAVLLFALKYGS